MKPRRDITLGEMQDECDKHTIHRMIINGFCNMKSDCKIWGFCPWGCQQSFAMIDLTDPPRFTEAQMAFLRGCYGIGIFGIMRSGERARTHFFTKFETVGFLDNAEIPLEPGETLDLAELFGKEGK